MADPQGRSQIVMETLGRLHELAVNLTTSNLAKQEEGSDTLLSVCQALETNDAVAYHLAALAVELSPTEVSDAQELASVISAAASPFTQMLDVEDLNAIYGLPSRQRTGLRPCRPQPGERRPLPVRIERQRVDLSLPGLPTGPAAVPRLAPTAGTSDGTASQRDWSASRGFAAPSGSPGPSHDAGPD